MLEQINADNMILTNEQFEILLPYKSHFETAVNSSWARNPGIFALDRINGIYNEVTKKPTRLNKGCGHCILTLLQEMGRIFLADLKERESIPKVGIKESLNPEVVKAEVKTKKRTTKKK